MQNFRDFMADLQRDKKRMGMVIALMAVGMLLWGRLLLKQVPRTATADDTPTWLAEAAEQSPASKGVATKPKVQLTLPNPPSRDFFAVDPSRYKLLQSADNVLIQAKSGGKITEETIRMSVERSAEGLRLQSVTQGEVPAAFINGRLIRIGGSIDGFTLIACDERSALLEKQGVRIRLGM